MNRQQLGKLIVFNAVLGMIAVILLTALTFVHISYNPNANLILIIAMVGNFGLAVWNWKCRKIDCEKET